MREKHIFEEAHAAMVISQMELVYRNEALSHVLAGGSFADIFNQWKTEERPELKVVLQKFSPESEIEKALSRQVELISFSDPRYPAHLACIDDAPLILYAKGKIEILQDVAFAIVGARHASFYGEEQARRFSRVLSDAGMTVVSGLARGIDEAAHEAALQGSGRTLAVLGCGIDVIYPRENQALYHRIEEQGLLVSEYPLGAEPRAYHFPRRNRILSGLSWGVFVVEAHERSGSLITAYQALEQGREVFALPGPVHHITSRGTHRLIREGATLVEAPEEILEAWPGKISGAHLSFPQARAPFSGFLQEKEKEVLIPAENLGSKEHNQVLSCLARQNRDYEELLELSGMLPREFARTITELEIEGKIRKNLSGYYEIA